MKVCKQVSSPNNSNTQLILFQGPDGIIIPCNLTKLDSNLHRVEIRTRHVGTYSVAFSQGSKIISSQSLQVFDPSKILIQEISDAICHRPGTIVGMYISTL